MKEIMLLAPDKSYLGAGRSRSFTFLTLVASNSDIATDFSVFTSQLPESINRKCLECEREEPRKQRWLMAYLAALQESCLPALHLYTTRHDSSNNSTNDERWRFTRRDILKAFGE